MTIKLSSWTYIGFYIVSALDDGENLSLDEVKDAMENQELIRYLDLKLENVDFSLIKGKEAEEIEQKLCEIRLGQEGRERRKFGIKQNGLALVLAYVLEAIQQEYS